MPPEVPDVDAAPLDLALVIRPYSMESAVSSSHCCRARASQAGRQRHENIALSSKASLVQHVRLHMILTFSVCSHKLTTSKGRRVDCARVSTRSHSCRWSVASSDGSGPRATNGCSSTSQPRSPSQTPTKRNGINSNGVGVQSVSQDPRTSNLKKTWFFIVFCIANPGPPYFGRSKKSGHAEPTLGSMDFVPPKKICL